MKRSNCHDTLFCVRLWQLDPLNPHSVTTRCQSGGLCKGRLSGGVTSVCQDLSERIKKEIDLPRLVVKIEGDPHGGWKPQMLVQRLGAVVARAHTDAVTVTERPCKQVGRSACHN